MTQCNIKSCLIPQCIFCSGVAVETNSKGLGCIIRIYMYTSGLAEM